MKNKKPYVYILSGMSVDGKISSFDKTETDISTDNDRSFLYDARIGVDAIMVGGNTFLLDDSALSVKTDERRKKRLSLGKSEDPFKVTVLSDLGKISNQKDFFERGTGRKIIFTSQKTSNEKLAEYKEKCEVFVLGEKRVDLVKAMTKLSEMGVKTLLVEGGGELNFSLLKENLVDELHLKMGNLILGGRDTTTLVDGDGFDKHSAKKAELYDLVREKDWIILKYKLK